MFFSLSNKLVFEPSNAFTFEFSLMQFYLMGIIHETFLEKACFLVDIYTFVLIMNSKISHLKRILILNFNSSDHSKFSLLFLQKLNEKEFETLKIDLFETQYDHLSLLLLQLDACLLYFQNQNFFEFLLIIDLNCFSFKMPEYQVVKVMFKK